MYKWWKYGSRIRILQYPFSKRLVSEPLFHLVIHLSTQKIFLSFSHLRHVLCINKVAPFYYAQNIQAVLELGSSKYFSKDGWLMTPMA